MAQQKPTIPKGTRDFGPKEVRKRHYIIQIIKNVFEKFGFAPIETPTMENLSTLTGKYGEEGDQLLFKILNSGDFLSKSTLKDYEEGSKSLLPKIAEKGLRYDLTVPFARFVAMHQNDIEMPFKRYQIQPVWRADRPQKGRYREFYQCDADVVGTNSLLCEAEVIMMINEVLPMLGITDFTIKINNRKILEGICEVTDTSDKFTDVVVAIDKLDKIGEEGVKNELLQHHISLEQINRLFELIQFNSKELKEAFSSSPIGKKGIDEIETVFNYCNLLKNYEFDVALARGLSYYTGCIFEVKVNNATIGSISGGGRYDDLTSGFGLNGVSGVGFSFGLDRIYDVMTELNTFPNLDETSTKVLLIAFYEKAFDYAITLLVQLRNENIKSELYPDIVKIKKSMSYANKKNIPYVLLIGEEEMQSNLFSFKNMEHGTQQQLSIEAIIQHLK